MLEVLKRQDFCFKTKTNYVKTKTKTFCQVLGAPRDYDHVLEDYITVILYAIKFRYEFELLELSIYS